MKKFINKLSSSGNLREEPTYDKEHLDTHFRKPTTLSQDTKDTSEEIKLRKSFSLSKATSPRFRASMDTDDFSSSKKKSSSGIKKEGKDNEKLHESDDKAMRKSFSLRGVFNKSSDQINKNETVRSPSLKGVFSSYDKVQNRHPAEMDGSDSEEDQDAFVPHNDQFDDKEYLATSPIRVPSAPGRMSSSPVPLSPTRASPSSPPMHLSTSSVRSPNSNNANTLNFTPTSSSSGLSASTPIIVPSSPPSTSVQAFTQSPPSNAQVPRIVAVDEFDSHFNFNNNTNDGGYRGRTDSITDDYGSEFGRICTESKLDGADEGDDIMDVEEDSVHVKKGGLFGFGQNKPRKLKA